MVVLASAGGNTVAAIARLVQADEDSVRQVIHRFNEMGMASLDPRWAGGRPRLIRRNRVELCFTPTYASWANPIEAQFGPLRTFVVAGSNHPHHTALTRHLHAYLRWRNANARHPDILAAQRRERARIRSERQRRWGQPATRAA
jgi:hypothetical protein